MVVETSTKQLEVVKARDIKVSDNLNFLVCGRSGSGKTHFASTFNKCGEVLIIDFDNGLATVRGKDGVSCISIGETFPRPTAYQTFMGALPKIEQSVRDGRFKAVCLDSLTTFAEAVLNQVMFSNGKFGQNPTFGEWGDQQRKIKEVIDRLNGLKCHTIVTAHVQFKTDEVGGRTWCLPMVTGQTAVRIPLYFDEVYYLFADSSDKGTKYSMLTRTDRYYDAKSRLGYVEAYVEPSYVSVEETLKRG